MLCTYSNLYLDNNTSLSHGRIIFWRYPSYLINMITNCISRGNLWMFTNSCLEMMISVTYIPYLQQQMLLVKCLTLCVSIINFTNFLNLLGSSIDMFLKDTHLLGYLCISLLVKDIVLLVGFANRTTSYPITRAPKLFSDYWVPGYWKTKLSGQ